MTCRSCGCLGHGTTYRVVCSSCGKEKYPTRLTPPEANYVCALCTLNGTRSVAARRARGARQQVRRRAITPDPNPPAA